MEIPLCFGTAQHSDKSLICKRCSYEYKCFLAWNKKKKELIELENEKNQKRIDEQA